MKRITWASCLGTQGLGPLAFDVVWFFSGATDPCGLASQLSKLSHMQTL